MESIQPQDQLTPNQKTHRLFELLELDDLNSITTAVEHCQESGGGFLTEAARHALCLAKTWGFVGAEEPKQEAVQVVVFDEESALRRLCNTIRRCELDVDYINVLERTIDQRHATLEG